MMQIPAVLTWRFGVPGGIGGRSWFVARANIRHDFIIALHFSHDFLVHWFGLGLLGGVILRGVVCAVLVCSPRILSLHSRIGHLIALPVFSSLLLQ